MASVKVKRGVKKMLLQKQFYLLKPWLWWKNQHSSVLYNCTLLKLRKGSPVTFSGTSEVKRKPNRSSFLDWGIHSSQMHARRLHLAIYYQFQIQLRYNNQKPSGPVLSFIISLNSRYSKQMTVPSKSPVTLLSGSESSYKLHVLESSTTLKTMQSTA